MKISFCISTSKNYSYHVLNNYIPYIFKNSPIGTYEIISVGDETTYIHDGKRWSEWEIPNCCDFTKKPGWITAKKNYAAKLAKYDVCVFMHDYIKIEQGFYEGFEKFGWDWDIAMCKILDRDGIRWRDWVKFFGSKKGRPWVQREIWQNEPRHYEGSPYLLDYDDPTADFINGTFWICKRHVMIDNPLDERLVWGQSEDCLASLTWLPKYRYVMNQNSYVSLLKEKPLIYQSNQDIL